MPLQSMDVQEKKKQQELFKTLHEENLRSTCSHIMHVTCNLKRLASALYFIISLRFTVLLNVILETVSFINWLFHHSTNCGMCHCWQCLYIQGSCSGHLTAKKSWGYQLSCAVNYAIVFSLLTLQSENKLNHTLLHFMIMHCCITVGYVVLFQTVI